MLCSVLVPTAPTKYINTRKRSYGDGDIGYWLSKKLSIPEIQMLEFHLPHVRIIGTHNCGKTCCEVFKHNISFQNMLCFRYFVKRVSAIFAHQIQSTYYGANIYVSIEGNSLEQFIASKDMLSLSSPK